LYRLAPRAATTHNKTNQVMVQVMAKPAVQREQVRKFVEEEVRATVRLYLDGKIRDWYSRSDGKGIILMVNATSIVEAKAITEALPLSKAELVDHEYTKLGPLAPLYNLVGEPAAK
jgi:hypothetical protein